MDMTPEEQRVLQATKAAIEAGEDPFGDDEELVRTEAEATPPDDQPAADAASVTAAADANTEDGAAAAAEAEPPADAQPAPSEKDGGAQPAEEIDPAALAELADPLGLHAAQPTRFQAEVAADLKEQRKALRAEKAAALTKLMNGEIDADAYAAEEDRIGDALDALNRQEVRAETLQEVNRQNDANYNSRVLKSLIATRKAEVDYANDAKAQRQFDQALSMLGADPDNAGRDFAEIAEEAHRAVAALRGVQAAAPTNQRKPSQPPDRRPQVQAPVTLRDMPAAAQSNSGGSLEEQLGRLSGVAYEEAFSKLSPAAKARLLDE